MSARAASGRARHVAGASRGAAARRALASLAAVALVVLAGRALAYALVSAPGLDGAVGGPTLPTVILVSAVLGLGGACAVLWLASLGVRERALLVRAPAPRLAVGAFARRAAVLFVVASAGFVALESYLHWRAGLGFHGLHCLTGPVHHDALPILAALSLVAAALIAAVEHVLAWMRRTIARLRGVRRGRRRVLRVRARGETFAERALASRRGARAPPLAV